MQKFLKKFSPFILNLLSFCILILYLTTFLKLAAYAKEAEKEYFLYQGLPLSNLSPRFVKGEKTLKTDLENDEISTSDSSRFLLEKENEMDSMGLKIISAMQAEDKNPLNSYIQKYVLKDEKINEGFWSQRIRLGVKSLTILYGSAGGLPYISPCCEAAQGNTFLCILFAGSNVISSGGATIWAGLRITEHFDPASEEEKKILRSKTSCNLIKHIACNFMGILACVPGTYSVYKYNSGLAKFLTIPGFLNNYIFSTSGYYEITNSNSPVQQFLSRFKRKDEIFIESNKIKEQLINCIEDYVIPSIIKSDDDQENLFMEENLGDTNIVKKFIEKSLSLRPLSDTIESPEKWKDGYPRKMLQAASIIFPLSGAVVNYLLGYEAASVLIDSPILCHAFSGIVVIPNFTLDLLSSTATSNNLFDMMYNKIRKRSFSTFVNSFYPTLNLSIPLLSITLATFSVTGGWIVSYEAIENSELRSLSYILPPLVFISNAISQSFKISDLLHQSINYYSSFKKNKAGEVVNKVNRLEKFTSLLSDCVPSILYKFGSNLGQNWDRRNIEEFSC